MANLGKFQIHEFHSKLDNVINANDNSKYHKHYGWGSMPTPLTILALNTNLLFLDNFGKIIKII